MLRNIIFFFFFFFFSLSVASQEELGWKSNCFHEPKKREKKNTTKLVQDQRDNERQRDKKRNSSQQDSVSFVSREDLSNQISSHSHVINLIQFTNSTGERKKKVIPDQFRTYYISPFKDNFNRIQFPQVVHFNSINFKFLTIINNNANKL